MNEPVVEKNKEESTATLNSQNLKSATELARDWLAHNEERRLAEENAAKAQLRDVCAQLDSLGIHKIFVEYDGYGDEGQVQSPYFDPTGITVGEQFKTIIEDATYCLLPEGWETDDGSYGEIAIDVKKRSIAQQHSTRFMDYTEETLEINLEDNQ